MFLFVGGVFFTILIYPIWLLIHCALSENRSTKSKVIWIILMLLAWPFTAIVYGLFGSKRRLFQWLSGIIIGVAIAVFIGFSIFMAKIPQIARQEISNTIAAIDRLDTTGISESELKELKLNMMVLGDEMRMMYSRSSVEKVAKDINLMKLFYIYIKDNRISMDEYSDWVAKYKSREMLDRKALEKYIDGLEKK